MSVHTVRSYTLFVFFFFVVVFFLPLTQDMFAVPKWHATGFFVLALLLSSVFEFLFTKKIVWKVKQLDTSLIFFVIAVGLSTIFQSINKVQALSVPHFSLLTFVFLTVLSFYFSRSSGKTHNLGIITAFFFMVFSVTVLMGSVPFFINKLPSFLQHYRNITLAGTLIDAFVLLSFAVCLLLAQLLRKEESLAKNGIILAGFALSTVTSVVVLFTLVKNQSLIVLPSYAHSWYAAVEVLKQPITALIGVGVDNFQIIFARVKDTAYNTSSLWHISSFTLARTIVFHTLAETGVLGLGSFLFILVSLAWRAFSPHGCTEERLMALYFIALSFLFPPSFITYLLLFVWVGLVGSREKGRELTLHFEEWIPVYVLILLGSMLAIGTASYMLGLSYQSEYVFKQALETKNLKAVYEKMRTAVTHNDRNERMRSNFAQIHLLIANTIAERATKNEAGQLRLSEEDRQTVSQAIQAAINEAKAVVSLNPNKSTNWELLASVYKSITGVVQGADAWTISAYQRAIVLDPHNPSYRVALGGVLYGLKQYDDAVRFFEQAITLKPDWPNAQYNYAWALAQKGQYQQAASAMQTVIALLNPTKDEADYKKATADLEEFKKHLPEMQNVDDSQEKGVEHKETLTLPRQEESILNPKIALPNGVLPE